jgi:Lon protease-like protein
VEIPLFPLNTVLFPGGPLPLRIFEARYLDMLSERLRADAPFGVLLIREGREAGPATTVEVGTLARVTDWYQGSDGLLGVTALGEQRFRLHASSRRADGLNIGEVELLPDEPPSPLPDEYREIATILAAVLDDLGRLYESLERRYEDASWVSWRFVEVLPLDLDQKQACLESSTAAERLALVRQLLETVRKPD